MGIIGKTETVVRFGDVAYDALGLQLKQGHAIHHEAGQMVRRQTVAQMHRQIKRLGVVHRFEGSTHAHQYTITAKWLLLFFLSSEIIAIILKNPRKGEVSPACEHA